ncbi:MAG: UDP-N-acetylmuramoyl-L-alanine--D-glutamate ligase [Proteobacteria bacterium]|nr:UDP-N-acetylmuramoyl-L-alanine--D-glutamate ligase [Pseudomonadota bacterium]
MIEVAELKGRRVAVMGLGRSGMASALALRASGAEVLAWDDKPAARDAARDAGLPLADLGKADFAGVALLVLSPGIPDRLPAPHPVAARASAAGCEIVCDVELLCRARPEAAYFGVTGTNGKSTTTTLIGHILRRAERRVAVGGNLGPPALGLEPLGPGGTYVLELSSYQLERSPTLRCDVAVLLNLSPDHLERHGGMDGYVAAKRRIFQRQRASDTAIVGVDDGLSRRLRDELLARADRRVVAVSGTGRVAGGIYADAGRLCDESEGRRREAVAVAELPALPGSHNWQNAAAAFAAARATGVARETIVDGLRAFPGLAHRQERVAEIGGVAYVNDSKGTNADATARALACYEAIYWIAGGVPKEGGIEPLRPHFRRLRHAYLIGQSAPDFARTLGSEVPHTLAGDLAAAVGAAHARAQAEGIPGAVVLLSPAAASFDQFANFEARGDAFRALVRRLAEGGR